jgi:hypothetical protein
MNYTCADTTYTSASLAMSGLPTAMMIALAVVILPERECSSTLEVLVELAMAEGVSLGILLGCYARMIQVLPGSRV